MSAVNLITARPGIWRSMVEPVGGHRSDAVSVRRVIAQYALSGFIALVVLGATGVYLLRQIGQREAIRDARQVAQIAGHGVVEPALTRGLASFDPGAIGRVDRTVRRGVLDGRIVRVKIWKPDGTIVYSDEHRLIGSHYPIGADERQALVTGKTDADISDLTQPENRFERRYRKLLEVYLPIRAPTGGRWLFETYERYSSVAASGRRLWLSFLPAILGTLALLWVIQLPVAWRGARRLRQGQVQREQLLRQAIDSSELERRRIARDLHDGAVQDLAGVSFGLTARADTIAEEDPTTASALRDAAAGTRRTIRELRSLLVDIYPPDLHRTGLAAALRDLVAPLAPRGITATLDVPNDLRLPAQIETLFYRCAQEALRNVATHSRARTVHTEVETTGGLARLIVSDDGVGFDGSVETGHMGLRLLADLVREAGGRLEIDSSPDRGTRICVEAPR